MLTRHCWNTYSIPTSLVNVGSEAICMSSNSVISFRDIKTGEITYFEAENTRMSYVGVITGHNRYPFMAFAEDIISPFVHIVRYPELKKYATFDNKNILKYVDLKFNEYDLLIGLSGVPNYTICIWNWRTGQNILQHDTNVACSQYALTVSPLHSPQIVLYSEYEKTIMLWEIRVTDLKTDLHKVYVIDIPKKYILPNNTFTFSYMDDNTLYYVNNSGTVFSIEEGQYYLKSRWSIPAEDVDPKEKLKYFTLYYHKHGLLVSCFPNIYYIRKQATSWSIDWKLTVDVDIKCIISTISGEIFASTEFGKIWSLSGPTSSQIEPKLTLIDNYNNPAVDFVTVRGSKEDCILQLTKDCKLITLSLNSRNILSIREIPDVTVIIGHVVHPYVIAGTTKGLLHFLNYDKPTEPIEVAIVESEEGIAWKRIAFADKVAIMLDACFNCYIFYADFMNSIFSQMCLLDTVPETYCVLNIYINDDVTVFMFVSRLDDNILYPHLDALWLYNCQPEQKRTSRKIIQLPYTYRCIVKLLTTTTKAVDGFGAARINSPLIDIFQYYAGIDQLQLMQTIRTNHVGNIIGISGWRNIMTWGFDASYMHLHLHKKTSKMYAISQCTEILYGSRFIRKVRECFGSKFYVVLYDNGGIKLGKINDNFVICDNYLTIDPGNVFKSIEPIVHLVLQGTERDVVVEHTQEELNARNNLLRNVQEFGKQVTALIDYDINVAGETKDMFRKFCLNHIWLNKLTEEAEKLCQSERNSLTISIEDQSRIRDWIYNIITKDTTGINSKLRTIFSAFFVENYGIRKKQDIYDVEYNLFRFYDMKPLEVETEQDDAENGELKELENEVLEEMQEIKEERKYFIINGSPYEHVMSDELAMQDTDQVTAYFMFNQWAKYKVLLVDLLKEEFNKKFDEARKLKGNLIDSILQSNAALVKIFSNMNCMLDLLNLKLITPAALSVPEWQKDEIIERIIEVDDSEIKAINRRKKKVEEVAKKRGRLLLWSADFWYRALQVMMDGVLEKLWEEEIKKDVPIPEFILKKQPAEYSLEEQKMLREYEEKVRLLTEDRKKYLSILKKNEVSVKGQKRNYILQINQNITELMITKLKFDYAIRHVNLRNSNTRLLHFRRLKILKKINEIRDDVENVTELTTRKIRFNESFNKSIEDYTAKVEAAIAKERGIDRHYKNQFLSSVPAQLSKEMNKAYKRRPKLGQKILQNSMITSELSKFVVTKVRGSNKFPWPKECDEYLEALDAMDESKNMPPSLDAKTWDQFIKLRRHKIEMELKIRSLNVQLADCHALLNNSMNDVQSLRTLKTDLLAKINDKKRDYVNLIYDQRLELRLTLGQIEYNIIQELSNFKNCVLMHVDDINDINELILKTGQTKLKAMERVAYFRRKVIYKEWEHRMVYSNITYLKYILRAVCQCKVSLEFLHIIRNWNKTKANKDRMQNSVGLIEKVCADKIKSFRRNLQVIIEHIAEIREKIDAIKRSNQRINRQMDEMKVCIAMSHTKRDFLIEEKHIREQQERMSKIRKHAHFMETIRSDYIKILELETILELLRLRTYPTLGPNPGCT